MLSKPESHVPSTSSSPPFPFNRLPVELLIVIFKKGDLTSWSEYQPYSLPFPVVISHVCRQWRNVALEAATLWSDIYFCGVSSLAKNLARVFWERSRGSFVDVRYNTHKSYFPNPFEFLIDCVLPQFERVRRLDIMMARDYSLHSLMDHLAGIDAPNLETLRISAPSHLHSSVSLFAFASEAPHERLTLFNGSAPFLRSVSLGVPPGCLHPKFTHLTSFTLWMRANEGHVSLQQFFGLLTDISKTLIRLVLAGVIFDGVLENAHNPPIELPALKSLSLYVVRILPILHTPILEHLYLDSVDDVTMNMFIKGWSSSELSTLLSLTLRNTDLSCFTTKRASFRGLSKVDELILWDCDDEVSFLGLLNEGNGDKEVEFNLMPRLHSLVISDLSNSWSLLQSILSSRIANGDPIKLVRFPEMPGEVDRLDWLARRDIRYIPCEYDEMHMDPDIYELLKEEERHDRMIISDEDDGDSSDHSSDSSYEWSEGRVWYDS